MNNSLISRIFSVLISIFIIAFITFLIILSYQPPMDTAYANSLVNRDFKLELNDENASLLYNKQIVSRDSLYIFKYQLQNDYISQLKAFLSKSPNWLNAKDQPEVVDRYISEYASDFDVLLQMENACKKDNVYLSISDRSQGEHNLDFSIGVIDYSSAILYYFYLTT